MDRNHLSRAMQELGWRTPVNWAYSPQPSPDGRFVAYASKRMAAQEAVDTGNLDVFIQAPVELWLYDRESKEHQFITRAGLVQAWLDDTNLLLQNGDGFSIYELIQERTTSIPAPNSTLVAAEHGLVIFTLGPSRLGVYDLIAGSTRQYTAKSALQNRPVRLSPNGRYLPVFESDQTGSRLQFQVVILDVANLMPVLTFPIPEAYSAPVFNGWLDHNQLLITVTEPGSPTPLKERVLTLSVPDGESGK